MTQPLTIFRSILAGMLIVSAASSARSQAGNSTAAPDSPAQAIEENTYPQSDNYPLGPDSKLQPSNPAGKMFEFTFTGSQIFPNTTRDITVYIPAAYTGQKPACVYIGLDGLDFNAPTVFDNLIAEHGMPVTIAIGVSPGAVASSTPPENPRFDRSLEFDSLNDRLARFLLNEIIPAVERRTTPGGKPILLSHDPNDRAIGGASTGGIGAFTVAWERPDAFRRVFTAIGTFVAMRGGEQYYVLVRKTEPKPIRIFMQDGTNDEWGGGPEMGDWWMSNQTMNRALEFAGYDVRHVWGVGSHNGSQAAAIFPDAMRWLWRDWPAPISAREPGNPVLKAILAPSESWQAVADLCAPVVNLAADLQGEVFYESGAAHGIARLPPGNQTLPCAKVGDAIPFSFGPQGKFYAAPASGGLAIRPHPAAGSPPALLARDLNIHAFTVRNNGDTYAATQAANGMSDLWLIHGDGKASRMDQGLSSVSGLAVTPDGLWLFVAQHTSRVGLSYRIQPDGTLDSHESFYDVYAPSWADDSGAASIAMDRDGRAYLATRIGIQVFDRNGRVAAILPLPNNEPASGLAFGGQDFDTLFVAGEKKIYRRKLHVAGTSPWAAPIKLPPWGSG
jgi:gluconolactonase